MIVDDDNDSRLLLRTMMARQYDVVTCSSGEEALASLGSYRPDLVLMDVEMPGLNGYETCHQIKLKDAALPIIFVTAHQTFEEHLKAYDAGGDDITTKPVDSNILLHKAKLAIRQKSDKDRLTHEAKSLHDMAMSFLSNAGESGVLLNFVRKAVSAKSYEELAHFLVRSASEFGEQCCVMLRHPDGKTFDTSHGEPTRLEVAIMEKMAGMGRLPQGKRQFIVNYDHVSIMITTNPQNSPEKIGRMRDNSAILAEIAEAVCENVSIRIKSTQREEQMKIAHLAASATLNQNRIQHKNLLVDSRILLQELLDNVELAFSRLNLIQSHESTLRNIMNESIEKLFELQSTGDHTSDERFHKSDVPDRKNKKCTNISLTKLSV